MGKRGVGQPFRRRDAEQDDGEQGKNCNLPSLSTPEAQNNEAESTHSKNVCSTPTPKTATTSELNTLKTLETYITKNEDK